MRQQALPGLAPEDDEGALRRAYERVPGLQRRVTFDEAMADHSLRVCLRLMVRAAARRQPQRRG